MSSDRQEQERLRRIRQRQLAERDPGTSKIPRYDWAKHAAKPKPKPKPLLLDLWDILPTRWKGAVYGVLFGAVIAIILIVLVLSEELRMLALAPVLIGGVVGMVIGKIMQSDDLLR